MDETREQHRQRSIWIAEKQVEAFEQFSEVIVECLDKRKEVYTLRDLLYEYEQIQRDMMLKNEKKTRAHYARFEKRWRSGLVLILGSGRGTGVTNHQ
jgi:hypothetical protein